MEMASEEEFELFIQHNPKLCSIIFIVCGILIILFAIGLAFFTSAIGLSFLAIGLVLLFG